ncbi:peptidylprolyl isomerase [Agreia sp. Leaf283]|uniref:peptidylprolyl isomerase n=1 Tax=Agreia sp. Leaf283 TaxID=1736321 RepID=UPI0006FA019E|nr:peptidylprolyl isomerase [Agreia sp. Leaf283]KQP55560.1 peptidylprolyl isomerase [Agreia sp. Leaf283]
MAPRNQDREARAARQRLRDYQARQTMHASKIARRRRDNILAVIVALLVIAAAVVVQVFYFSGGPGTPTPTPSSTASPTDTPAPTSTPNSADVPDPAAAEGRTWTGDMTINDIPVGISLDGAAAPQGVANFVTLAQKGFYNGLTCHRLTTSPGFGVLQCGDPNGDGSGGPGYSFGPIENAPEGDVYPAGTIAMARQSENGSSMGSQFFIVYEDTTIGSDTAGGYTVLGTVTSGLDELKAGVVAAGTADGSADGKPAIPVTIGSIAVQ